MLSGVLGRGRPSGDNQRNNNSQNHNISNPRPSFTNDTVPSSPFSPTGTPGSAAGASSSSLSGQTNGSNWPTSPTFMGSHYVPGTVKRQDSLGSMGSASGSKVRRPSGPTITHPNSNVMGIGATSERLASHSLLPEEMRALQKEKERERDAALHADMARQGSSGMSTSGSSKAASASKVSCRFYAIAMMKSSRS